MSGKSNNESGLTDAQQRFADEYLVDFNATAAYQRAGYKANGNAAKVNASRLLGNEKLQAYLATKKQAMLKRTETDADAALRRLTHLALGDRRRLFTDTGGLKDPTDLTEDDMALIAGIEILEVYEGRGDDRRFVGLTKKVKLVNPLDSVKTLGQHFGLFAKKHEHKHQVEGLGDILKEIAEEGGGDTGPGRAKSRRD